MTDSANPTPAPAEDGLYKNTVVKSADDVWFLWRKLSHKIVKNLLSRHRTDDPTIAGQAVGEAFRGEAEAMAGGREPWLVEHPLEYFTVAALHWLTKNPSGLKPAREYESSIPLGSAGARPSQVADPSASRPSSAVQRKQMLEDLARAVDDLDPLDRKLLELREKEGRTIGEIAKELGMTPKAIQERFYRIRKDVRLEMGRRGWSEAFVPDPAALPFCSREGAEKAIEELSETEYRPLVEAVYLRDEKLEEVARRVGLSVEEVRDRAEHGLDLVLRRRRMTPEDFRAAIANREYRRRPTAGEEGGG